MSSEGNGLAVLARIGPGNIGALLTLQDQLRAAKAEDTLTALAIGAGIMIYVVRPWRMGREDWRVAGVRRLGEGVVQMVLRGPADTKLGFRAGQFVWMTIAPFRPPLHDHPFSIASSPKELPELRLIVREAGDCTKGFVQIEPGRRVFIDGPHGSFVLPASARRIAMVAGGVGIAPLIGMLEAAAATQDKRKFHLLYAARNADSLAGLDGCGSFSPGST